MAGFAFTNGAAKVFIHDSTEPASSLEADTIFSDSNALGHVVSTGDIGTDTEDVDVSDLDSEAKESENGKETVNDVDITINLLDAADYSKFVAYKKKVNVITGFLYSKHDGTAVVKRAAKSSIKKVKWNGASIGGVAQITITVKFAEKQHDFLD